HVRDLFGTTPAAEARLWRFACEVDLVATVSAEERSVDEPLPWLLRDARAVRQRMKTDFLWARLLDVPAALAARRYLRDGELVLEVRDAAGFAAGRFALTGSPSAATTAALRWSAGGRRASASSSSRRARRRSTRAVASSRISASTTSSARSR